MISQPHPLTLVPLPPAPQTQGALAIQPLAPTRQTPLIRFPWCLADLTPIERHVFRCATTHAWAYNNAPLYQPATEHQLDAAYRLADSHLLQEWKGRHPAFALTILGEVQARRFFRSAPSQQVAEREIELDVLRALMRNGWFDHVALDKALMQAIEMHLLQLEDE